MMQEKNINTMRIKIIRIKMMRIYFSLDLTDKDDPLKMQNNLCENIFNEKQY